MRRRFPGVIMASVTLADVRKVYPGGAEAVRGVSFGVPDGSFCVLVGPSGCGKSTLLRMVAGLETISGGTVSIGPRVVNAVEPAERDIAMVFQNYALYPHMSVYDNMAYGLRNRGTPKPEIDERVREAARILDVAAYLDRRPRQLSGGQRQRVAPATGAGPGGGGGGRGGLGRGTAVELGLRPEDLRLAPAGQGLPFAVDFIEELGATQLVHGRVGAETATVQVATGDAPTAGTAGLTIDPAATHLFDPATGARL